MRAACISPHTALMFLPLATVLGLHSRIALSCECHRAHLLNRGSKDKRLEWYDWNGYDMDSKEKNAMKLFENADLGNITLRNRIVMPAMATLFGNKDGTVSDRLLSYYAKRSKGGVGLVIVENTAIRPDGVNYKGALEIHDEKFEKGLSRLSSVIKSTGAAAAIQLFHPGRQVHPKYAGNYPIGPSPVPCPIMGGNPRVLETDEIRDLVQSFVEGAVRAKKVGFDAVEIHGAHGYLVAQFLSPFSNKRNDAYGGDSQRRARFAVEIVEGIRERLGESFPIIMRISADEKVAGGLNPEKTLQLIPFLEKAGITAIHVSAGCYPTMEWVVQPYPQPPGCLVDMAANIKRTTALPVLTVGRINDPMLAESIIKDEKADFVSMGRALIADPDLPNKAKEGRVKEIRPCIACNTCIEAVGMEQTRCAVNPEMGYEYEALEPVDAARRVLVVGGGPGGMEAAISAHALGHKVKLIEAREELGGQLWPAAVPDSKTEIRKLLEYYLHQIENLDIELEIGKQMDLDDAKAFKPHHIFLATGAMPIEISFSADNTSEKIVPAVKVLREKMTFEGNVLIIGGGLVGLDTAEFLASKGAKVTVLEMKKNVGAGIEWNLKKMKLRHLKEKGIDIITRARVKKVEKDSVIFKDHDGKECRHKADLVVTALGSEPYNPLEQELRNIGLDVIRIGDCKAPRGIAEAISEGFNAVKAVSGS